MPDPAGIRRLDFPEPFGYQSGAMPPFPAFAYDALPGRVLFGVGSVEQLGEEVDRLGARRVLAIASKRAIDGLVERLGHRLAASFTDVQQHVPVEAAARAVAAADQAGADCLVALGGGSATGMAKALDRADAEHDPAGQRLVHEGGEGGHGARLIAERFREVKAAETRRVRHQRGYQTGRSASTLTQTDLGSV